MACSLLAAHLALFFFFLLGNTLYFYHPSSDNYKCSALGSPQILICGESEGISRLYQLAEWFGLCDLIAERDTCGAVWPYLRYAHRFLIFRGKIPASRWKPRKTQINDHYVHNTHPRNNQSREKSHPLSTHATRKQLKRTPHAKRKHLNHHYQPIMADNDPANDNEKGIDFDPHILY